MGWKLPPWAKEADTSVLEKHGIATKILSVTSPGASDTIFERADAAKLARQMNEIAAKMRDDNPAACGFFVNLPSILDKEETLSELKYGLDVLHGDGVCLFTRYGTGYQYLGHPDFQYLWEELDRRSAVVFVHPTHPVDTNVINPLLRQPLLDYAFETTKSAVDLILSGTIRKFKNLKIILSHAGGSLPYLIERPASIVPCMGIDGFSTKDILEDAREFYFDTALSGGEIPLSVLQKFAKPDHILYGSDFPYAPPPTLGFHTGGLDAFRFDKDGMSQDINVNNALALFPRLKKYRNAA